LPDTSKTTSWAYDLNQYVFPRHCTLEAMRTQKYKDDYCKKGNDKRGRGQNQEPRFYLHAPDTSKLDTFESHMTFLAALDGEFTQSLQR
jgi:hypothetical protein